MNNKGMSFVETLLTVAIIMILTGTLIPIHAKLNESLFVSQIELHASQVAYNAAKQILNLGITSGSELIDQTNYQWSYNGQSLCVNYQLFEEVEIKCFGQEDLM